MKARSRRGAIGQTWWSTRFIEVLEDCGLGSRLARGKAYARSGQVLDLEVSTGEVVAHVQGSRRQPYLVRIGLRAFGKAEWLAVAETMAADAWYAAQLLAGNMPHDVEDLFAQVDLSLFPDSAGQLDMDCSCPDWEVPCKHLAAVFYLLAEAFDDDPFLILAWRGRERDDLLGLVASKRPGSAGAGADLGPSVPALGDCLGQFFVAGQLARPQWAPGGASLVDQLPRVDVQVGGVPLVEVLRPVWARAAGLGDTGDGLLDDL
jgi:uncharacterized Zn finger protein